MNISEHLIYGTVIAARSGPRPAEKQRSVLCDTSGAHSGVSLKACEDGDDGQKYTPIG